jgi:hypothetical protein
MADVTINNLSDITPSTGLFLPASNGSTTGRVTLSGVCGVMSSAQIISALGYTPYNGATNPNGYITNTNTSIAKAWVNFNGTTGTQVGAEFHCTIRSQYNVSSVVRERTGVYRINFATEMSNANYMTQYTGGYWPTQDTRVHYLINSDVPQTAASVTVACVYNDARNVDTDRGNVLVFST